MISSYFCNKAQRASETTLSHWASIWVCFWGCKIIDFNIGWTCTDHALQTTTRTWRPCSACIWGCQKEEGINAAEKHGDTLDLPDQHLPAPNEAQMCLADHREKSITTQSDYATLCCCAHPHHGLWALPCVMGPLVAATPNDGICEDAISVAVPMTTYPVLLAKFIFCPSDAANCNGTMTSPPWLRNNNQFEIV